MTHPEHASIFVKKETRTGIKVKAAKLDHPSMISLLEKLDETPIKDLEVLRNNHD